MRFDAKTSRREFVKSTALAAVAAAVHEILPPVSLARGLSSNSRTLSAGWEFCRSTLGGVWDVWRADEGNDLVWRSVRLPHCWNARDAVDPDEPYYEGPAWYRTGLDLANPFPDGHTLLHFEAAGQSSQVYVYLDKVGEHLGGYDEFLVDITAAAAHALKDPRNKGTLPVAIRCDNSRDLQSIPSGLNDFCRYGGLYRAVNLIYLPAISLERIHIETLVSATAPAQACIKARLYNPSSLKDHLQISIRVFDPAGSLIHDFSDSLAAWEGERTLTSCPIHQPQLWSPSNPALYRCELSVVTASGTHDLNKHFGLRYFEFVEHGPFILNGQHLPLRGTQREEDHASCGAAMPDNLIRQELEMIKSMGANFLGLGHHQQAEIVLDLCDELGLLVLEEIPWSRGGLGSERYKQEARDMLRNMIDQHFNHPSVILWGLGNENDWPGDFPEFDKDQIRSFVLELNAQVHSLDPSRKTFLRRCDFARELVDVYSPSIWAGWYHGPYTAYANVAQREFEKVNHFLHIEWGGDSHARRHSEDPDRMLARIITGEPIDARALDYFLSGGQANAPLSGDWSETYVCNLFDWHLKEQETMPWLSGSAQWIFKDFATPLRPNNPVPFVNQKGLVERDLTLKEGYYVFQSYWAGKPMLHIYGHSWPVRWGRPNEQKLVKIYSNCESVELFANGKSQGVKKRQSHAFPAAGLHWLVPFLPGENELRAVGRKNSANVSDQIRFRYQIDAWNKPARLELNEKTRDEKTVTVEAELFDAANVPCLDARNRLRFSIAGRGTLLDNLGTVTGSRSVEASNGRAQICIATIGGESVVSVSAEGLPSAFLKVT